MGSNLIPQKQEEQRAFEAFLRAFPSLANQIKNWRLQEKNFPDVVTTLHNGQQIGFELGRWIHENQVRQHKKRDQFDSDIQAAIRPQPNNTTRNIHCVLLTPDYDHRRLQQNDGEALRAELIELINEKDQQWSGERGRPCPRGEPCELARFPTLNKYLKKVWCFPLGTGKLTEEPLTLGTPWISIKARAGSYSGDSARNALEAIIRKKACRYGSSTGEQVSLLIHYGVDAYRYNTPFMDTSTPDFNGVAQYASEVVRSYYRHRNLPFEKVYLYNTLQSELEAYEIFPRVLKCH